MFTFAPIILYARFFRLPTPYRHTHIYSYSVIESLIAIACVGTDTNDYLGLLSYRFRYSLSLLIYIQTHQFRVESAYNGLIIIAFEGAFCYGDQHRYTIVDVAFDCRFWSAIGVATCKSVGYSHGVVDSLFTIVNLGLDSVYNDLLQPHRIDIHQFFSYRHWVLYAQRVMYIDDVGLCRLLTCQ